MYSEANYIRAIDVHTAARGIGRGVTTIINTGIDASGYWNVSALAMTLVLAYQAVEPLYLRGEVEDFFAALFADADEPTLLGCQIAQHGVLHPSVEQQLLARLSDGRDRDFWRHRLRAMHLPPRHLGNAEAQLRLLAGAFR